MAIGLRHVCLSTVLAAEKHDFHRYQKGILLYLTSSFGNLEIS